MKIMCVGHAAYDITFPVDKFPKENTKNRVLEKVENGGGPANTAAYLLGKWGADVSFVGVVGKDLYGKKIKTELDSVGVNTKYLMINENYQTTSSLIVANKENGSRTILTYRPTGMNLESINLDFIPDIFLFDGQEIEISEQLLTKYPTAISIIDAGRATDEIIELSKKVNYVVCSKEFAESVSKVKIDYNDFKTLEFMYKNLKEIFDGEIIVTLESKGCLYQDNNILKIMSSISVTAIDSTGAGDIFHGAFVYGISTGMKLEQVLKLSNIAAGLSVTKIGSRNSIFTLEEIKELEYEFK